MEVNGAEESRNDNSRERRYGLLMAPQLWLTGVAKGIGCHLFLLFLKVVCILFLLVDVLFMITNLLHIFEINMPMSHIEGIVRDVYVLV